MNALTPPTPITPMTAERVAELRDLQVDSTAGDAPYNPDMWTLDAARRELVAEVDRLNGVVQLLGSELQRDSMKVIDQLKHEPCVSIEDVERFLKRERDTYEARGQHWRVGDDILDAFRLHMVTGTPLTSPRPEGGPEALGVGPEPKTEAEELREEGEKLRAELEANRQRWYHNDQSRTLCVAGHDPETRQCAEGGGPVLSEVEYLTQLVEIWQGLTKKAMEGEDKARADVDCLTTELDAAKAVVTKALGEVEHEEVVYLLRRYLGEHEQGGGRG
uniref:hypothetical protein n=1 Tax=Streptosporangium sp. CA-235898 TaxID=3240073 RepID=UPI003F49385E